MAGEAPLVRELNIDVDPAATAASASEDARVPFDGTIQSVTYVPTALITGVATNNRTVQVINRGQTGAGSTVVATLTFGAGTNAPAFDETPLTLQAAANLAVASGDVLEFRSSPNGTGLADPGGRCVVNVAK